jgi:hypothetical protein
MYIKHSNKQQILYSYTNLGNRREKEEGEKAAGLKNLLTLSDIPGLI